MNLNIGCGADYREGWINLDFNRKFKAEVYFDLNQIYKGKKLPFRDKKFDLIILYDVLEHFPEPLPILREMYGVCKIGGVIEIKVPLGNWVWDNLDHKHQFSANCFNVINFDDYSGLGKKRVELIDKHIYYLPSKNIVYKIGRWIFRKNNIHLKYKIIM